MIKLKKKGVILLIAMICIIMLTNIAFAVTGTWSTYEKLTLSVGRGDNTKSVKKTSSTDQTYLVVAKDKTMWTSPECWLNGDSQDIQSDHMFISKLNTTYTGGNNTGKAGRLYHLTLIPGYGQIGTDYITLKFNPK